MSRNRIVAAALTVAMSVGLSACGGGGGETHVASTPTPPPPPPPPPAQSSAKTRFGVTGDAVFPAIGDAIELRWSAADNAYTLVTSTSSARLTLGDTTANYENHYPSSSSYGVTLRKDLDTQYTNLGVLFDNSWGYPYGAFAYGIPTAANDVPVSGSATYTAMAVGGSLPTNGVWDTWIGGEAKLSFDFAAGSLGGYFDATILGESNSYEPLARYDFVNTVFGSGSTTFSGGLQTGSINSLGSFNGLFTGPNAAELMARWSVPYINPSNAQPGTITGVWIGKKD